MRQENISYRVLDGQENMNSSDTDIDKYRDIEGAVHNW